MKKKLSVVFGIVAYTALVLALVYLYREGTERLFQVYAFCTIALLCGYVFLLYSHSKIAVLGVLLAHILALISLWLAGSMLYLSVPYILLPFVAIMLRAVWMEKMGHTLLLWLEPALLVVAIVFYMAEIKINPFISRDTQLFPIAYLLVNGLTIGNVLWDGLKIKGKTKKGCGLSVGTLAPGFCLDNENNEKTCLADILNKHHVLLIFVRGEWCPLCHIMLRTYMKESAQFCEKGVFLLVIGPDPTGVNKKLAEELKLDFHILSDPLLQVTASYRLKIKAAHLMNADNYTDDKEIPLPASFLIDKAGGIIRYCSHPAKIGEVVKLNDIFQVLQALEKKPA